MKTRMSCRFGMTRRWVNYDRCIFLAGPVHQEWTTNLSYPLCYLNCIARVVMIDLFLWASQSFQSSRNVLNKSQDALSLQSMCLQVWRDKCCMAQTPAKLVSACQFFRDGKYPRTKASTKKLETTFNRYLCLSKLTPECSAHSGIKSCHSHYPDPKDVLTSLSQHATHVCDCRKQRNWDLCQGNMCQLLDKSVPHYSLLKQGPADHSQTAVTPSMEFLFVIDSEQSCDERPQVDHPI